MYFHFQPDPSYALRFPCWFLVLMDCNFCFTFYQCMRAIRILLKKARLKH